MALRSPSSTPQRDLVLHDSSPADSPPPTSQSQGGSSNGAKADVGRETKGVDHLLAKLEKEGVEVDGKIVSIIEDGIAGIKAEAVRENINEPKTNWMTLLLALGIGFIMGAESYGYAFRAANAKELRALEEKLAKRRRS